MTLIDASLTNDAVEDVIDVPELLVEIEGALDLGRVQHAARRPASASSSALKSRCSANERIALRCTHS